MEEAGTGVGLAVFLLGVQGCVLRSPASRRLADMLHFRKMEYISLLASFRAHASEELYHDEDPHWTPRAQDLAAQIVADHLRRSS